MIVPVMRWASVATLGIVKTHKDVVAKPSPKAHTRKPGLLKSWESMLSAQTDQMIRMMQD